MDLKTQRNHNLIAAFLEIPIVEKMEKVNNYSFYHIRLNKLPDETFEVVDSFCHPKQMKFHTHWSWIMPVVEKIETLKGKDNWRYEVHIDSQECYVSIESNHVTDVYYREETKIESVYNTIIEFIKYYNKSIEL